MALANPPAVSRFAERIARDLHLNPRQVTATTLLLEEGATIPFISRYRKEATGSLDEVAVGAIRDRLNQLTALEDRREAILKSLRERDLLTAELGAQIGAADTLSALEDLYAPHRPKRRTRAIIAREKGLEPLAEFLLQQQTGGNLSEEALKFVAQDLGVEDIEQALAGARDIIAERVSDQPEVRSEIRKIFASEGKIHSKVVDKKKDDPEAAKYRDYFDWTEPLESTPSHRLLAMRRGEKEGFLRMGLEVPEQRCFGVAERHFMKGNGPVAAQVREAAHDGCSRLLFPSLENEAFAAAVERADEEAVRVFASNLRELLLASPLGQKRVLALDPGFRTGCKMVCLDAQGQLLDHDVIFATGSERQQVEAAGKLLQAVKSHKIEAIAIGNGTAGRETEQFVRRLRLPSTIPVVVVNESGASIYSASEVARREFPDQDVTVRGAVSIGRRLMDPLAELVKIDAKSIGVGQYQHDVNQDLLKASLDDCVMSCVNQVGVEVNTASPELLSYVSGLNRSIAENIVAYRNENGPFASRAELKKVPRLGAKAFEQAAGFLRIRDGKNPLDASAVHPERYDLVKSMAKDTECQVADLLRREDLRRQVQSRLNNYVSGDVGLPTLRDILDELAKPGRDPRRQFEVFSFAEDVQKPSDLKPGMKLPGIVTNVTKFGAFVDIGVHQDGLVHISQLSDQFVKDPAEVVKVNQKVMVTVTEVDLARNRISLSMKAKPELVTSADRKSPAQPAGKPARAPQEPSRGNAPLGGDWFSQALSKDKDKKR